MMADFLSDLFLVLCTGAVLGGPVAFLVLWGRAHGR